MKIMSMSMKMLITIQARFLKNLDKRDDAIFNLVTTTGVIRGIPLYMGYAPNNPDEKFLKRVFLDTRESGDLFGDDLSFVLKDVTIYEGGNSVHVPCLIVRYCSVLAFSVSI